MFKSSLQMTRWSQVLFAVTALSMVLVGCGEENPTGTQPQNTDPPAEVVRVNFASDQGEFQILATFDDPGRGQFAIYGRNIRYDGEVGGLVADLSAVNLGDDTYNEPVTLTFLSLLPEGVTVLNPDNDKSGAGAMIVFEFANDDGMWTPDEESLPRETQFGVDEGISIGFVGRLDVGDDDVLGSVGGMVWNDENGDGILDENEEGLEGATVLLRAEGMEDVTASTGSDGVYEFTALESGFYTVMKMPAEGYHLTTAGTMYVLLVHEDGGVSSFLAANFGWMEEEVGGTAIIKGKVWNDMNGNGSQDDGEPGLEGVTIDLSGDATGRQTSDADGNYAFVELTAGDYVVVCNGPEGWVATTESELRITLETDDQVYNEASFGWREE